MRRFQLSTVLLCGTLAMFLTGCSRNPMSPDSSSPAPGGAGSMVQTGEGPADVQGGTAGTLTATFLPTEGGRLTVGRWTLDLHKNSLKVPATITLRVPTDDALNVEIEVVPAEAGALQVPAELMANVTDQTQLNWDTIWMWSWVNGEWVENADVAAQPNPQVVMSRVSTLTSSRLADHVVVPDAPKGRKP